MIQIRRYDTPKPEPSQRFAVGALVRHRRYDYRGLVVAVDPHCMASEEWYLRNKTQPERDQTWYHVLVHGGGATTYAAEASLTEEWLPAEIHHPLVSVYFHSFETSYYLRNEVPWGNE
ncbi:MAG: heat shock protein HspQ [Planctomycetota bacterium]|jgi:heat shock protein HspQ